MVFVKAGKAAPAGVGVGGAEVPEGVGDGACGVFVARVGGGST